MWRLLEAPLEGVPRLCLLFQQRVPTALSWQLGKCDIIPRADLDVREGDRLPTECQCKSGGTSHTFVPTAILKSPGRNVHI